MNFSPAPLAAADDASLIARYIAGDDAAFSTLLYRHQSRVYTTLMLMVRDKVLAEDLTQETFLKVINKLRSGTYRENGRFGAWLARVTHNTALDALRRERGGVSSSFSAPTTTKAGPPRTVQSTLRDTELTPDTRLEREDIHEHLRRYIEDLPVAQRQVLLMRHYGQMSFQDIAEATGVSINTALGRMRYALRNLRTRMYPSAAGASLLIAALLSMPPITKPLTFATAPAEDCHDQNLYPRDADPVRV